MTRFHLSVIGLLGFALLCVCVLFALILFVDSDIGTTLEKTTGATASSVSLDSSIPANRKFNHDFQINTEYDRFGDYTTVTLKPKNELLNQTPNNFYLVFTCKGTSVYTPQVISWDFVTRSPNFQFLKTNNVIFLLDGKERIILDATPDGTVYNGYVLENLNVIVTAKDFLRIVSSKTVEVQIANYEFSFTEMNMEALRDFASRMNP